MVYILVKFRGFESPVVGSQQLLWMLSLEKFPSPPETNQICGGGGKWCCHLSFKVEVELQPFVKMGFTSSQETPPSAQIAYGKNNNNSWKLFYKIGPIAKSRGTQKKSNAPLPMDVTSCKCVLIHLDCIKMHYDDAYDDFHE